MSVRTESGLPVPGRILVVGTGGREHALAWRLSRDPGVERVIVAPGNPGIPSSVAARHPTTSLGDIEGIVGLAVDLDIDLVVIGPEGPLVAGLADRLDAAGVAVFGPTAAAARIEGSKAWCREIAQAAGVSMAQGAAFSDPIAAVLYAEGIAGPVVVKADGLAAGKGVTVCFTLDEARRAIREVLIERVFGPAGSRVVVERALAGTEASVIAICDATTALALPPARDHKRVGEGDTGPNTGGMGAVSPPGDFTDTDAVAAVRAFHRPVLAELEARGTPYRGALFAGLMLTPFGSRLLEFNARFGDPETQAILPRLGVPLAPLLLAAATDRLAEAAEAMGIADGRLPTSGAASAAVVLATPGYPETPEVGAVIEGLERPELAADDVLLFQAGVTTDPTGRLITSGGRVLSVVGLASDVPSAAVVAQTAAAAITFPGVQRRRDIGGLVAATDESSPASTPTALAGSGTGAS